MNKFLNSSIGWNLAGTRELSLFLEADKQVAAKISDETVQKVQLGRPKTVDVSAIKLAWEQFQQDCEVSGIKPTVVFFCEKTGIKRSSFFSSKKAWTEADPNSKVSKKFFDWGDDD